MAVLAVSYASSARAWLKQRSEINALHAEIAQRQAAVSALGKTARRWKDPAYIEAQARLRFGWVMPGETGYRVIDAHGHVLPDGGGALSQPSSAVSSASPQWWQTEWGTVVEAGRDPAAAPKQPARKPAAWIGRHQRQPTTHGPDVGNRHPGTPPAR